MMGKFAMGMKPPKPPRCNAAAWSEDDRMTAAHDPARAAFQHDLDSVREGQVLQLLPHEFAGPAVLRRRCILDGQGATVWALRGPVLTVEAEGVTIRNLRLEVTAEGVEDQRAFETLWLFGCDIGQGYYFAKPMPEEQLTAWLRESRWAVTAPCPTSRRSATRTASCRSARS